VSDEKRIVIECDCVPCHDWMAFSSWYSFRKMAPHLEVVVKVEMDRPLFRWVPILSSRTKVVFSGDLLIPPTVMAVREFSGDWSLSSSKSESQTFLVDYSLGCGNFVVDKWINKDRHPFHNALRNFGTSKMTVNEVAVLKMWERCEVLHRAVGV
jgi:hypothetical protein